MKTNRKELFIISIFVLTCSIVFCFWFVHDPVKNYVINVQGMDKRPARDTTSVENIKIGEKFKEYKTITSALTGKWPRFRGAQIDNINKENIKLISSFGKAPKIAWKVDVGDGHAAPAVYNGKVYIIDYDERKKADALRCFSLESGEEIWRRWYSVILRRNHGMSRTIPAVTDKYIITIGPRCHVMCCDPVNGNLLWGLDMVKAYNTDVPLWFTGQCPMIDHDTAIIAPCGKFLMAGIDCKTGKEVWHTPNPDNWKMSHSSIMPMVFEGKKMYVYFAVGGLCGISAQGRDKGQLLWKTNVFNPSVIAPSPVILDKGRIFMTAGYGAGAILFQLVKEGERFSVKVIQQYKPTEGLASEQQTPVYFNHCLFAILPKDAGAGRNQFVCCKDNDCTKFVWTSSKTDRYGLGPYIMADGKFFILSDEGEITIAKVSTTSFIFLDKAKILDGQDAWGPMAIADGRLIMRDAKHLVCIDVRAN